MKAAATQKEASTAVKAQKEASTAVKTQKEASTVVKAQKEASTAVNATATQKREASTAVKAQKEASTATATQIKLRGLIPRTRREKLLERKVFAMPSSLSTGPLTNLSAARYYGFLRMLYVEHYRTVSFAYLILRRNIRPNILYYLPIYTHNI